MRSDQTRYDIFISYARVNNRPIPDEYPDGWVKAIRDHILADHRRFSTEPLRIFFDEEEIRDMDDWRHRIVGALRQSKVLLVCLSPEYFRSDYCRWEWKEYVARQVHRVMGSDSFAGLYFIDVPGSVDRQNAEQFAEWVREVQPRFDDVSRGNYTDIRPWFPEGAAALQREEVRRRMARLGECLWERLQRARRAVAAPGNLRRQNPHFVGRRQELRQLHEQLGVGTIGVVTAMHGLGGQGKTELAVAYAHAWADCYPAGLWVLEAEGRGELLPLLGELAFKAEFARDVEFPFIPTEAEKNNPAELGRAVLLHLQRRAAAVRERDPDRGAAALILLDNVSKPELLSSPQLATVPRADWLRIVATTRLDVPPVAGSLTRLPVDSLDEENALTLIREHQPPRDARGRIVVGAPDATPAFTSSKEEEAARRIVRMLGGFTLAVEQVAVYLGLHPEIAPSDFLNILLAKGLTVADTIPARDADVAARMLTQSKQLDLILQSTLTRLDLPARTVLSIAALLPPDLVPWPWLRELTIAIHPELGERDDLGADPWLALGRRLVGLRLLTDGDDPQVARIHRLVAAHCLASDRGTDALAEVVNRFVGRRANSMYGMTQAPDDWELDALLAAIPHRLDKLPTRDLACDGVFLSEKVLLYRGLPAAGSLMSSAHPVLARLAASDPANAAWQRDLSVSLNKLGDLAVAQGDLPGALARFTECLQIRQRLAASDPANAAWQRDLSVSLNKLGDLAVAQGDLPGALRFFAEDLKIAQRLAASDPANAEWQRDLVVSHLRQAKLAEQSGNPAAMLAELQKCLAILQRMKQRELHFDPAMERLYQQLRHSLPSS